MIQIGDAVVGILVQEKYGNEGGIRYLEAVIDFFKNKASVPVVFVFENDFAAPAVGELIVTAPMIYTFA